MFALDTVSEMEAERSWMFGTAVNARPPLPTDISPTLTSVCVPTATGISATSQSPICYCRSETTFWRFFALREKPGVKMKSVVERIDINDLRESLMSDSDRSDDEERDKDQIDDQEEPDFTSHSFLWGLYIRYVEEYVCACKNEGYTTKYMLTPGLFCQYLSIRTLQAVRASKPFNISTVHAVISEELVKPGCMFQQHPAGPIGYISIFEDDDGDRPMILRWG
jgi:hypothetical protein